MLHSVLVYGGAAILAALGWFVTGSGSVLSVGAEDNPAAYRCPTCAIRRGHFLAFGAGPVLILAALAVARWC